EASTLVAVELVCELGEVNAQPAGKLRTERGFARTAQSDERDPLHALVARAAVIADKLRTHGGEGLARQTLQELRRESQLDGVDRVLGKQFCERKIEGCCDLAQ